MSEFQFAGPTQLIVDTNPFNQKFYIYRETPDGLWAPYYDGAVHLHVGPGASAANITAGGNYRVVWADNCEVDPVFQLAGSCC